MGCNLQAITSPTPNFACSTEGVQRTRSAFSPTGTISKSVSISPLLTTLISVASVSGSTDPIEVFKLKFGFATAIVTVALSVMSGEELAICIRTTHLCSPGLASCAKKSNATGTVAPAGISIAKSVEPLPTKPAIKSPELLATSKNTCCAESVGLIISTDRRT